MAGGLRRGDEVVPLGRRPGHVDVQYNLAAMCEKGDGVHRDPIQDFVWYNAGQSVAARLRPDQIAEVRRREWEWLAQARNAG